LNIFLRKVRSNKGMSVKVWSHFMKRPGFALAGQQLNASPGAISWKNPPGVTYNQ
jgi:hypothetical protein